MPDADAPVPERVSTLELFFDLVFVFTITQVSMVVASSPDGAGIARAAIQLGVIYWMYDGYAWMTNAAGPDTWQRTVLLLVGMAGFFVCALAVPRAFGEDGIAFGFGYLIVTLVHLCGFLSISCLRVRPTMTSSVSSKASRAKCRCTSISRRVLRTDAWFLGSNVTAAKPR
jgi:low temperature requirement protein LtrA